PHAGPAVRQPLEDTLQALVVAAFPVDAAARRTPLEALVKGGNLLRDAVRDRFPRHVLERRVALPAAPEGLDQRFQLQPLDHLGELRLALHRAHAISPVHLTSAQEPAVTRED